MEAKIIAHKIHDICRRQKCLTHKELGPSRTSGCCGNGGDIIRPPQNATSVTFDNLRVKKIYVQKKSPNPFKEGYWDLTFGFVFEYLITFWEMGGCEISTVEAGNAYSMKVTMHGGKDDSDGMVIATDSPFASGGLISAATPFFRASANAVILDAEIYNNPYQDCRDEVHMRIGLFTVVQLLRFACLNAQLYGS
jgi:hypothetical protein